MNALSTHIVERPHAIVLVLAGDAGVTQVEALRRAVDEVLMLPGKRIIVDITKVDFIGSLGLGQLVRLALAVRARGGLFRLCGAQAGINLAIAKSKLSVLLPIFRDLTDAER
jgi:anti-anti-sigma factor